MNVAINHNLKKIIKLEEKHTKILWGLYELRETYFTCPLCKKRELFWKDQNYTAHRNKCNYKFSMGVYPWPSNDLNKMEFFINRNRELYLFVQNFETNKTLIYGWPKNKYSDMKSFTDDITYYSDTTVDVIPDVFIENDFIMFNFDQVDNIKYIKETLETYLLFS